MKRNVSFIDEYAVSELVGGLMLILIALIVFSVIYMYVFPLPFPPPEPNVKLMGYVNNDGLIVIEHMGGESLSSYRIDVRHVNGTLIDTAVYKDSEDLWEISGCNYPLTDVYLLTEDDMVRVTVYSIKDGNEQAVFDGILRGKASGIPPPSVLPMLISSLRDNTTDEDLICFNYTMVPEINALTYIYNWSVNGNSMTDLLLPFDTNSSDTAKDYSGNENDGTVTGPTWVSEGKVGGAYHFGGDFGGRSDHISFNLPSVFNNIGGSKFTISLWLKSDDISNPNKVVLEASQGNKNFARFFQRESQIHFGVCIDGVKYVLRTDDLSSNTWYNIVGTWDGNTNTIGLSFNGEAVNSTNIGWRRFPLSSVDGLFKLGHGAPGGGGYFPGFIDEVQVIRRVLSEEQIYQNYLCTRDGLSDKRVMVSEETNLDDIWKCTVTPNDSITDDDAVESNTLQIESYSGGGQ